MHVTSSREGTKSLGLVFLIEHICTHHNGVMWFFDNSETPPSKHREDVPGVLRRDGDERRLQIRSIAAVLAGLSK